MGEVYPPAEELDRLAFDDGPLGRVDRTIFEIAGNWKNVGDNFSSATTATRPTPDCGPDHGGISQRVPRELVGATGRSIPTPPSTTRAPAPPPSRRCSCGPVSIGHLPGQRTLRLPVLPTDPSDGTDDDRHGLTAPGPSRSAARLTGSVPRTWPSSRMPSGACVRRGTTKVVSSASPIGPSCPSTPCITSMRWWSTRSTGVATDVHTGRGDAAARAKVRRRITVRSDRSDASCGFRVGDDFRRFSQVDDVFSRSRFDPDVHSDAADTFYATYRRPLADWRAAKGYRQHDYAFRNATWHVADVFAELYEADDRRDGFLDPLSMLRDGAAEQVDLGPPEQARPRSNTRHRRPVPISSASPPTTNGGPTPTGSRCRPGARNRTTFPKDSTMWW